MTQNNFPHSQNSTPPRTILPVLVKTKETYQFWLLLFRNFPKTERFGIGNKIDQSFLDTLELIFCLGYLSVEHKIPILNRAITKFDLVKFFTQLAWENRLIPTDKYSILASKLGEIGRQLGGWKKGLQKKTSAI